MASEEHLLNEFQQIQLRSQILVYRALSQGAVPEETLMIGAFSDTFPESEEAWDEGRHLWERPWAAALERSQRQSSAKLQPWRSADDAGAPGQDAEGQMSDRDPLREAFVQETERQTALEVENAEMAAISIMDHSEDLHERLKQGASSRPQQHLASAAIAFAAASAAAKAAADAAKLAQAALLRAKRVAGLDSNENVDGRVLEETASNHVLDAISQARMALTSESGANVLFERFYQRRGEEVVAEVEPVEESNLKSGSCIEVLSESSGLWRAGRVLAVLDGIVQVLYENDESKEWIPVRSKPRPRIRPPHPSNSMSTGEHTWVVGDLVDVRVRNGWMEGMVTSSSERDGNSITVFFPGECASSCVEQSHLRPSLLWQGKRWVLLHPPGPAPENELVEDLDAAMTGPPTSYKMRNLIDVISKETDKMNRAGTADGSRRLKHAQASKRPVAETVVNGHKALGLLRGSTTKVMKARKLIEKATGSRLLLKRLARGRCVLKEMIRLKSRNHSVETLKAPEEMKQQTGKLLQCFQTNRQDVLLP